MFNRLQVKDPSQRPIGTKKQSKSDLLKQAESRASEVGTEVRFVASCTSAFHVCLCWKQLNNCKPGAGIYGYVAKVDEACQG